MYQTHLSLPQFILSHKQFSFVDVNKKKIALNDARRRKVEFHFRLIFIVLFSFQRFDVKVQFHLSALACLEFPGTLNARRERMMHQIVIHSYSKRPLKCVARNKFLVKILLQNMMKVWEDFAIWKSLKGRNFYWCFKLQKMIEKLYKVSSEQR